MPTNTARPDLRFAAFLRRAWVPIATITSWVIFAWIPWYFIIQISSPGNDYDVPRVALISTISLLLGGCVSAIVLYHRNLLRDARQNWVRLATAILGVLASTSLIARAFVIGVGKFDFGPAGTLLIGASFATIFYTPILLVAVFWPTRLRAAVARVIASFAIHRASRGPIAFTVAGSLILILSADVWRAMDAMPASVTFAFWLLGTCLSASLLVRGVSATDARARWLVVLRLCVASAVTFLAFFVAGANLVPPAIAADWSERIVDAAACSHWDACTTSAYVVGLAKLSGILTSIAVTGIGTSFGANDTGLDQNRMIQQNDDEP